MDTVVQLLANTVVDDLSQQADLLGSLQHELFHRRSITRWQAPDDASQCISAARVIICQLSTFVLHRSCAG